MVRHLGSIRITWLQLTTVAVATPRHNDYRPQKHNIFYIESNLKSIRCNPHICLFLLQAIACYTPKFLWEAFEGGLMRQLAMGLHLGICKEEEKQAKKRVMLNYLTMHLKVSCPVPSLRPDPVREVEYPTPKLSGHISLGFASKKT